MKDFLYDQGPRGITSLAAARSDCIRTVQVNLLPYARRLFGMLTHTTSEPSALKSSDRRSRQRTTRVRAEAPQGSLAYRAWSLQVVGSFFQDQVK